MGNVCVCVCVRAPTGEMLPCWSPRQAGLRVPWHAPCVLAHGPILGIQVWLGGGGGGPCDSALGGRWTLHTVLFCALELIHRERASLCPTCVCP